MSEKEISDLTSPYTSPSIEFAGYPTRRAFKREKNPERLRAIRERLGISEEKQVVVLQMGKQGVGTLKNIVKKLNETPITYDRPIHLAVFCGTNENLRLELQEYIRQNAHNHPQIHFDFCPLLDQQAAADYLKIADKQIIKPGGSTSAEALKMGLKSIIFVDPSHFWEACNKEQMLRHGLGTEVAEMDAIPELLRDELRSCKDTDYEPIDAEKEVPRLVEEAIASFRSLRRDGSAHSYIPLSTEEAVFPIPKGLATDYYELQLIRSSEEKPEEVKKSDQMPIDESIVSKMIARSNPVKISYAYLEEPVQASAVKPEDSVAIEKEESVDDAIENIQFLFPEEPETNPSDIPATPAITDMEEPSLVDDAIEDSPFLFPEEPVNNTQEEQAQPQETEKKEPTVIDDPIEDIRFLFPEEPTLIDDPVEDIRFLFPEEPLVEHELSEETEEVEFSEDDFDFVLFE